MKKWVIIFYALSLPALITACDKEPQLPEKKESQLPEKWEVPLAAAKGYEEGAEGVVVIDTKTGTDVAINISGLKPGEVYTAYFLDAENKIFEGIGRPPFVLPVDITGKTNFEGKIDKDVYKHFTELAIYLNPDKRPVHSPFGVKDESDALTIKKPKMVLVGKLN
jgi:hypothetical protein